MLMDMECYWLLRYHHGDATAYPLRSAHRSSIVVPFRSSMYYVVIHCGAHHVHRDASSASSASSGGTIGTIGSIGSYWVLRGPLILMVLSILMMMAPGRLHVYHGAHHVHH